MCFFLGLVALGRRIARAHRFKHYVDNRASSDRFVLMVEVWHPGLTAKERAAMATTFAVKDRFTLVALKQCPWGYSVRPRLGAVPKAYERLPCAA